MRTQLKIFSAKLTNTDLVDRWVDEDRLSTKALFWAWESRIEAIMMLINVITVKLWRRLWSENCGWCQLLHAKKWFSCLMLRVEIDFTTQIADGWLMSLDLYSVSLTPDFPVSDIWGCGIGLVRIESLSGWFWNSFYFHDWRLWGTHLHNRIIHGCEVVSLMVACLFVWRG